MIGFQYFNRNESNLSRDVLEEHPTPPQRARVNGKTPKCPKVRECKLGKIYKDNAFVIYDDPDACDLYSPRIQSEDCHWICIALVLVLHFAAVSQHVLYGSLVEEYVSVTLLALFTVVYKYWQSVVGRRFVVNTFIQHKTVLRILIQIVTAYYTYMWITTGCKMPTFVLMVIFLVFLKVNPVRYVAKGKRNRETTAQSENQILRGKPAPTEMHVNLQVVNAAVDPEPNMRLVEDSSLGENDTDSVSEFSCSVAQRSKLPIEIEGSVSDRERIRDVINRLEGECEDKPCQRSFLALVFVAISERFGFDAAHSLLVLRWVAFLSLVLYLSFYLWPQFVFLCALSYMYKDSNHYHMLIPVVVEESQMTLDIAKHMLIPEPVPVDEVCVPVEKAQTLAGIISDGVQNGSAVELLTSVRTLLGEDYSVLLEDDLVYELFGFVCTLAAMPSFISEADVESGRVSEAFRRERNRAYTAQRVLSTVQFVMRFVGVEYRKIAIGIIASVGVTGYIAKSSDGESFKVDPAEDAEVPTWMDRFSEVLSVSNGVYKDKDFWSVAKVLGFLSILPAMKAGVVEPTSVFELYTSTVAKFTPSCDMASAFAYAFVGVMKRIKIAKISSNPIATFLNMGERAHDSDILELTQRLQYTGSGEIHEFVDDVPLYMAEIANRVQEWKTQCKIKHSKKVAEKILLGEELIRRLGGVVTASGKVVEPLPLTLVGRPGAGKTEASKEVLKHVLVMMGIPNPVTAPIDTTSKFDDVAHPGVHGFTGDDPVKQKLEHTSNENKPVCVFFKYVSSEPVKINKAELSEKGWQYFNHWAVVWSMNSLDFQHDCNSDGAIKRRLGYIFFARPYDRFRLSDGRLDTGAVMDEGTYDTLEYQPWKWELQSTGDYKLIPVSNSWLSFGQFLLFMKKPIDDWLRKRKMLLSRGERKITKCVHGLTNQACPICASLKAAEATTVGFFSAEASNDGSSFDCSDMDSACSAYVAKSSEGSGELTSDMNLQVRSESQMGWSEFAVSCFTDRHGERLNAVVDAFNEFAEPSYSRKLLNNAFCSCVIWSLVAVFLDDSIFSFILQILLSFGACIFTLLWLFHRRLSKAIRYCNLTHFDAISDARTTFALKNRVTRFAMRKYSNELKYAQIAAGVAVATTLAVVVKSVARRWARTSYVAKSKTDDDAEASKLEEEEIQKPADILLKERSATEMLNDGTVFRKVNPDTFWAKATVAKHIIDEKAATGTMQHLESKFSKCFVQLKVRACKDDGNSLLETVFGFLLDNRVIVAPFHAFCSGKTMFKSYEIELSGSHTHSQVITVSRENIFKPEQGLDVAMVLSNKNFHDVPNIMPYFIRDLGDGTVEGHFVEYEDFLPTTSVHIEILSTAIEEIEYSSGPVGLKSKVIKVKTPRVMKDGECGKLLRFKQKGIGLLGAMLVAGAKEDECFAVITQGTLSQGLYMMKERLGYQAALHYGGIDESYCPDGGRRFTLTERPFPKSSLNYRPNNTAVEFKGSVTDPSSLRNNEELHYYSDLFIDCLGAKAHALPTETHLGKGVNKVSCFADNNPKGYDASTMHLATRAFQSHISKCRDDILEATREDSLDYSRPLDVSEALNGVSGSGVSVMKLETSDGAGAKKRDRVNITLKGTLVLTPQAQSEFLAFMRDLDKEIHPGYFSAACSKIENKEVKLSGDPEPVGRIFGAANFNAYLAGRMLLEPLMEIMKKRPNMFFTAIGVNCEDESWHNLMAPMLEKDRIGNVLEFDAKAYDACQSAVLRNASINVWIHVAEILGWDAKCVHRLENYLRMLCDCHMIIQGELRTWYNYFISGVNITAADNGLRGVFIVLYSFAHFVLVEEKQSPANALVEIERFISDSAIATLGDDFLAAVKQTYRDRGWSPQYVQKVSNECGNLLTSANKQDELDWLNLEDATFLKRRIVFSKHKNHLVGASTPLSFTKSMIYSERPDMSWEEHALELVKNMGRECVAIGESCYELFMHGKPMVDSSGVLHELPGAQIFAERAGIMLPDECLMHYEERAQFEAERYGGKSAIGFSGGMPTDISEKVMSEFREAPVGIPKRKKFQREEYVAKSESQGTDGPIMQSDETGFVQEQSNEISDDVDAMDLVDHSFGAWESRTVEIADINLPMQTESSFSIAPYSLFMSDKTMLAKHLSDVAIFNADIEVTASYTTSKAHSGKMFMYSVPSSDVTLREATLDKAYLLNRITCRNFATLDFAGGEGKSVLRVPFIYPQTMCPIVDSALTNLATVHLVVVHQARHQNGVSEPIRIKLRARLIEPQFGLSTTYTAKSSSDGDSTTSESTCVVDTVDYRHIMDCLGTCRSTRRAPHVVQRAFAICVYEEGYRLATEGDRPQDLTSGLTILAECEPRSLSRALGEFFRIVGIYLDGATGPEESAPCLALVHVICTGLQVQAAAGIFGESSEAVVMEDFIDERDYLTVKWRYPPLDRLLAHIGKNAHFITHITSASAKMKFVCMCLSFAYTARASECTCYHYVEAIKSPILTIASDMNNALARWDDKILTIEGKSGYYKRVVDGLAYDVVQVKSLDNEKEWLIYYVDNHLPLPGLCYLQGYVKEERTRACSRLGFFPSVEMWIRDMERLPESSLEGFRVIKYDSVPWIHVLPDFGIDHKTSMALLKQENFSNVAVGCSPPFRGNEPSTARTTVIGVLCAFLTQVVFEMVKAKVRESESNGWDIENPYMQCTKKHGDYKYRKKSKELVAGDTKEKISSKLKSFSSIVSSLKPVLSSLPYGAFTSDIVARVSGAAAGVLHHYGFSKPVATSSSQMQQVCINGLANGNGEVHGQVLGLDSLNETTKIVQYAGCDGTDELSFMYLKTKKTLISSFEWGSTATPGSSLWEANVGPNTVLTPVAGKTQPGDLFYLPPAAQCAAVTKGWQGSMVYTLEVNKSMMVSGKLQIYWDPHGGGSWDSTVLRNVIWDLEVEDTKTIIIHYAREAVYLRTFGSDETPIAANMSAPYDPMLHNGRLALKVFTRLVGSGVAEPNAGMCVWLGCHENMQFVDASCAPLMDTSKLFSARSDVEFTGTTDLDEDEFIGERAPWNPYDTGIGTVDGYRDPFLAPQRIGDSASTSAPITAAPTTTVSTQVPTQQPSVSTNAPTQAPITLEPTVATIAPTVSTAGPTGTIDTEVPTVSLFTSVPTPAPSTKVPTAAPSNVPSTAPTFLNCEKRILRVAFPPSILRIDGTLRHDNDSYFKVLSGANADPTQERVVIPAGVTTDLDTTTMVEDDGSYVVKAYGVGLSGVTLSTTFPGLSFPVITESEFHWSGVNTGLGHIKPYASFTASTGSNIQFQDIVMPISTNWETAYADSFPGGTAVTIPNPDGGELNVKSYDRTKGEYLVLGPYTDGCSNDFNYVHVVWGGNRSIGNSFENVGRTMEEPNGNAVWSNAHNGVTKLVNEIVRVASNGTFITGSGTGEPVYVYRVDYITTAPVRRRTLRAKYAAKALNEGAEIFGREQVPQMLGPVVSGEQVLSMRTLMNVPTRVGTVSINTLQKNGYSQIVRVFDPYNVPAPLNGANVFSMMRFSFFSLRGGMVVTHSFSGDDDCVANALVAYKCAKSKRPFVNQTAMADTRVNPTVTVKCPYRSETNFSLIFPLAPAPVIVSHKEYVRVRTAKPSAVTVETWVSTAEDFNYMYYLGGVVMIGL